MMLYNEIFVKLKRVSGVYLLYNKKDALVYVGKSTDLASRIPQSAAQRRVAYFRFISIPNLSDLAIVEMAYVIKHKPIYNSEFKFDSEATIDIKFPYEESNKYFLTAEHRVINHGEVKEELFTEVYNEFENNPDIDMAADIRGVCYFVIREYLDRYQKKFVN